MRETAVCRAAAQLQIGIAASGILVAGRQHQLESGSFARPLRGASPQNNGWASIEVSFLLPGIGAEQNKHLVVEQRFF